MSADVCKRKTKQKVKHQDVKKCKKETTAAGFEPTRANTMPQLQMIAGHRLNHSAKQPIEFRLENNLYRTVYILAINAVNEPSSQTDPSSIRTYMCSPTSDNDYPMVRSL